MKYIEKSREELKGNNLRGGRTISFFTPRSPRDQVIWRNNRTRRFWVSRKRRSNPGAYMVVTIKLVVAEVMVVVVVMMVMVRTEAKTMAMTVMVVAVAVVEAGRWSPNPASGCKIHVFFLVFFILIIFITN